MISSLHRRQKLRDRNIKTPPKDSPPVHDIGDPASLESTWGGKEPGRGLLTPRSTGGPPLFDGLSVSEMYHSKRVRDNRPLKNGV